MSGCMQSLAAVGWRPSSLPRLSSSSSSILRGRRGYAIPAGGAPRFQVFNRRTKWLQKERVASNLEESRQADYLKDEVAARLADRLLVSSTGLVKRKPEGAVELTQYLGYQKTVPQGPRSRRQFLQCSTSSCPGESRFRPGSPSHGPDSLTHRRTYRCRLLGKSSLPRREA